MRTGKIIAVTGIFALAGAGLYYFVFKKQQSSNPGISGDQNTFGGDFTPSVAANANTGGTINLASISYNNNYCNPPIASNDPQRELKKFYYRKQFAEDAWNAQGRGMSLEFFMKQFAQQQGC